MFHKGRTLPYSKELLALMFPFITMKVYSKPIKYYTKPLFSDMRDYVNGRMVANPRVRNGQAVEFDAMGGIKTQGKVLRQIASTQLVEISANGRTHVCDFMGGKWIAVA